MDYGSALDYQQNEEQDPTKKFQIMPYQRTAGGEIPQGDVTGSSELGAAASQSVNADVSAQRQETGSIISSVINGLFGGKKGGGPPQGGGPPSAANSGYPTGNFSGGWKYT